MLIENLKNYNIDNENKLKIINLLIKLYYYIILYHVLLYR